MPKYEVTSPDGKRYEVDTGDQQATQDELIDHIESQSQPSGNMASTAAEGIGSYLGGIGGRYAEIPGQMAEGFKAAGRLMPGGEPAQGWDPLTALGVFAPGRILTAPYEETGANLMEAYGRSVGPGSVVGAFEGYPGETLEDYTPEAQTPALREGGAIAGGMVGAARVPAWAMTRGLAQGVQTVAPESRIAQFIQNLKSGMPHPVAAGDANAAARGIDQAFAEAGSGAGARKPIYEGERAAVQGQQLDQAFTQAKVPGPAGEQMRLPDAGTMPPRARPAPEQLGMDLRQPNYNELDQWLGRPFAKEAELTSRMQGGEGGMDAADLPGWLERIAGPRRITETPRLRSIAEIGENARFPQTAAALRIERGLGELPEPFFTGSRGADIDLREAENLADMQRFPRAAGALREEARGGELTYKPITGAESEFDKILREAGLESSPVTKQGDIAEAREARGATGREDIPSEEFAASTESPGGRPPVDEAAALVSRLQKADAKAPGQWTDIPSLSGEANTTLRKSVFGLQGSGVIETQKLPDGRRQIRIAQKPISPPGERGGPRRPGETQAQFLHRMDTEGATLGAWGPPRRIKGGAERFPTAAKFLEAEVQKTLRDFDKAQAAAKLTRPIGGGAERFPSAAKMLEEEAKTLGRRNESLGNILYSSWIAGRLAGKALFNNFLYNLGLMGVEVSDLAMEAGRQKVRQAFTGQAPIVTFKEVKADIVGRISALQEAKQTALNVFRGGKSIFESTSRLEMATTNFPDWMKKIGFALPGKILLASDEWAKTINYKGKVHSLLTREIQRQGASALIDKDVLAQVDKMSKHEAELRTLTNQLPPSLESIRRGIQDNSFLRYLGPFMRTNLNDLLMAVEHIPGLGFMVNQKGIYKGGQYKGMPRRGDPEITHFSKQMTGLVAGLSTAWMLDIIGGKITGGGPTDPGEKGLAQQTPYTINIGGRQLPYRQIGTFGKILAMMADTKDLWDNIDQDDAGYQATRNIARLLTDVPGMDGMTRLSDAIADPEGMGRRYVQDWAASTAPAFLQQGYQAMDPGQLRRPGKDAPFLGIPQALESAWLGPMSDTPYLRDLWGQPVNRERLGILGKTFASEPIDVEMRRLAQATGKGVMPPKEDMGVRLNEQQYDRLVIGTGEKARLLVQDVLNRPDYPEMSNEKKLDKVRDAFSTARKRARSELLRHDEKLREQIRDQAREEVRKYHTPQAPGKALEKRSQEVSTREEQAQ